MSQAGIVSISGAGGVTSLTGNSGGAVSPLAGNIDVLGSYALTTVGTPLTGTLTVQLASGVATNGQVLIGRTGLTPIYSTITAGAGIAITNASGAITITNTGAGPGWNFVAIDTAMNADNGYVAIAPGAAVKFALPAVAAQGSELEILLDGATSWTITQAAGQRIMLGNTQTTGGVGGSITSTAQGDSLRLLCVVDNLRWVALAGVGNPIIV